MTNDKPLFVIRGDKVYCAHSRITIIGTTEGMEWYCQNGTCMRKFEGDEVRKVGTNWEVIDA